MKTVYKHNVFNLQIDDEIETPFKNDNNLYVLSLALDVSYNDALDIVSKRGQLEKLVKGKDISTIVFFAIFKNKGWRGIKIEQSRLDCVPEYQIPKSRATMTSYLMPTRIPYIVGKQGVFAYVTDTTSDKEVRRVLYSDIVMKTKKEVNWGARTSIDSLYVPEESSLTEQIFWSGQYFYFLDSKFNV